MECETEKDILVTKVAFLFLLALVVQSFNSETYFETTGR
jgi:hypothetical protein